MSFYTKPLDEVSQVLSEMEHDPEHAAAHADELAVAIGHMRDAMIDVPPALLDLAQRLDKASGIIRRPDESGDEDAFDNMPV